MSQSWLNLDTCMSCLASVLNVVVSCLLTVITVYTSYPASDPTERAFSQSGLFVSPTSSVN